MYTQLSSEQRYAIYLGKQEGKTKTAIALQIGVHKSTVSHELRRNSNRHNVYGWLMADARAKERRERTGRNRETPPDVLRPTKVRNIKDRVSIHERPAEADGRRFGDWEMDTIIGKGTEFCSCRFNTEVQRETALPYDYFVLYSSFYYLSARLEDVPSSRPVPVHRPDLF